MEKKYNKNSIQVGKNVTVIGNPNNRKLFSMYASTIEKYKPLSREEETELFKKLEKGGDTQAIKDKLCLHNLLFVISVAKKYHSTLHTNNVISLEDLVSEGNIGLYAAVDRFDHTTGYKFITYAVWWIRQHMLKMIQENIKTVRTPNNKQELIKWIRRKTEELEQEYGRDIDVKELFALAKKTKYVHKNTPIGEFTRTLEISKFDISFSSPLSTDSEVTLSDVTSTQDNNPHELMVGDELTNDIHKMLKPLPVNVRKYFIDYYGLTGKKPLTYREIGEKHDVTGERVRQLLKQYLRVLRHNNRDKVDYFMGTMREFSEESL